MASNVNLPDALRNIIMDAITTRAGDAALLRIYDGTQPADADTAVTGTLLAELVCGTPFAAGAADGILTLGTITTDASANATGTATHFRIVKADGTTVVLDGTVDTSGADLNLNTVSIIATLPVAVSSLVFTHGNV